MKVLKSWRNIGRDLVATCAIAFLATAALSVASDVFGFQDIIESILPASAPWLVASFDAFLILIVGALATQMISRLVQEQSKVKKELDLRVQLLETANDIILAYRPDGTIVYANETACELQGYARNELMALNGKDLLTAEDSRSFDEWVKGVIKKGEILSEGNHVRKNGTVIPVEIRARYVNIDGEDLIVCVSRDITERKEAETLYRNMADNSPVAVYIFQDKKFVFTNHVFSTITGRSILDIDNSQLSSLVYAEDRDLVRKNAISMLKGERSQPYEFRYVTKDGETRWALERVSSIFYHGRRATLGNFLDITEMKRIDERIERAAEEWRTTFDSITDMISIHDRENRLLRVNKAYASKYGKTPQEVIGKTCSELVHCTIVPSGECPHHRTLMTGKPAVTEAFDAGSDSWFQESTSPIFGQDGSVVGTVNIVKDITSFRRMEQQLMMTDRLASIGELVAGIAHELNNPLTGVIGFSQLLMERGVSEDIKEDLTTISIEAQRAARIVNNLLTFARKHSPVKQSCQINSIIEDVLRLRAYEEKVHNIAVIQQLTPDLPEIMADYFQLQQVFLNIVVNAEYFMAEARGYGTLTISTELFEKYIRISIIDDGPGIPQENLSRIFNPFFTTKDVGKGTGLGLSICHGIVSEHGGRITVRSEPGAGTTFIVELPLEIPLTNKTLTPADTDNSRVL
jgi:PAS domain S-box-containing protein